MSSEVTATPDRPRELDELPAGHVSIASPGDVVIRVENLWKEYRLGTINHGTLKADLASWWARMRGKDDPNVRIREFANSDPSSELSEDRFWALRDVSFDVRQGEVLGIIGKNGAGKSTLLKILSRVTTPTRGEIKVKGRVASLLEVGTGFHPELTGRENIFLNGAILGMNKPEIRRKLDEIIAFAEVERFIDTPVKRYSSGMYVRLAFAVAAHLEPEILIVDEVLAVGDVDFQKKCIGKMNEVATEGRTVIFVSHNMSAIEQLTSRCLVLAEGRIQYAGPSDGAVAKYLGHDAALSSTGMVATEDLDCERRLMLDDAASFVALGLAPGQPLAIFSGDSVTIEAEVRAVVEQHLCLGFTIRDDSGAAVCSGWSTSFKTLAKRSVRLTLAIEHLPLAPGQYLLNLALTRGGLVAPRRLYDLVLGFGRFRVADKLSDGRCIGAWQKAWGGVLHQDVRLDVRTHE